MRTKRCTACLTVKPLAEFSRNAASPDGLNAACKPCQSARVAASRARDREYYRQQPRAYQRALSALRDAHPDEFDALYAAELAVFDMAPRA